MISNPVMHMHTIYPLFAITVYVLGVWLAGAGQSDMLQRRNTAASTKQHGGESYVCPGLGVSGRMWRCWPRKRCCLAAASAASSAAGRRKLVAVLVRLAGFHPHSTYITMPYPLHAFTVNAVISLFHLKAPQC